MRNITGLLQVLQPAIELAEDGFPVSPVTAHQWRGCFSQLTRAGGPGVSATMPWSTSPLLLSFSDGFMLLLSSSGGTDACVVSRASQIWSKSCNRRTGQRCCLLHDKFCCHTNTGKGADDIGWQGARRGADAAQPRPGGHLPPPGGARRCPGWVHAKTDAGHFFLLKPITSKSFS